MICAIDECIAVLLLVMVVLGCLHYSTLKLKILELWRGIDASVTFTKGSLCSMKFFATKKHDMKKLEEIASILKKFHDCGMQLEKFEREQKERV